MYSCRAVTLFALFFDHRLTTLVILITHSAGWLVLNGTARNFHEVVLMNSIDGEQTSKKSYFTSPRATVLCTFLLDRVHTQFNAFSARISRSLCGDRSRSMELLIDNACCVESAPKNVTRTVWTIMQIDVSVG
jgi:hypothetical protein